MIVEYTEKPLVGNNFKLFRDLIMNFSGMHHQIGQHECVGLNIQGLIRNPVKQEKKSHLDR